MKTGAIECKSYNSKMSVQKEHSTNYNLTEQASKRSEIEETTDVARRVEAMVHE